MQKMLCHAEATCTAAYHCSGHVAFMLPTIAPASAIRFTPQPVVNWLYTGLARAIMALQIHLGTVARFNREGHFIDDATSSPASGGQVCAVWGTEIGARREQALIAWDYDIDLAVFKTPDCDFSKVWLGVQDSMKDLGLCFVEHEIGKKFRIAPKHCLAFEYPQERRHDAKKRLAGQSRSALCQAARMARLRHEALPNPTGINCVDIEVYSVAAIKPGANVKALVVQGSQAITLTPSAIFPFVERIFGPLRVPLPSTPAMLDAEYTSDWREKREIKTVKGNSACKYAGVPVGAKLSAQPNILMLGCTPLLGGFWGAGLTESSDEVPWRFLADPWFTGAAE
jgi:hypothetical protein